MKNAIVGIIVGLLIGTALSILAQSKGKYQPGPNGQIGRYQMVMVAAGGNREIGPDELPYVVMDTTNGNWSQTGLARLVDFVNLDREREKQMIKDVEDLEQKNAVKKYEKETRNK